MMINVDSLAYILRLGSQQSPNFFGSQVFVGVIALLTCLFTIIGIFVAAKFASDRFLKNHNIEEEKLFNDFKMHITKQIAVIDQVKIGWAELETHKEDNKKSVERVHGRVDSIVQMINDKFEKVNESMSVLARSVATLCGQFEEHKNND